MIRGQKLSDEVVERAAQIAAGECRPISDHRASEEYRCRMVEVLTKRAIQQALS
jgi:carbon-monoxide dehydrogenase medium subunit